MILISFFMIVGYSKKPGFAQIEWASVWQRRRTMSLKEK